MKKKTETKSITHHIVNKQKKDNKELLTSSIIDSGSWFMFIEEKMKDFSPWFTLLKSFHIETIPVYNNIAFFQIETMPSCNSIVSFRIESMSLFGFPIIFPDRCYAFI